MTVHFQHHPTNPTLQRISFTKSSTATAQQLPFFNQLPSPQHCKFPLKSLYKFHKLPQTIRFNHQRNFKNPKQNKKEENNKNKQKLPISTAASRSFALPPTALSHFKFPQNKTKQTINIQK